MRRIKRRIGMLLVLSAVIWSCNRDKRAELIDIYPSTLPHEGASHQRTWITFNGSEDIKQNLILLASSIAQYEPVSIVVDEADRKELLSLLGNLDTHHYSIEILASKVTSPWIRDEGPTFVYDEKESLLAIDFNYNHLKYKAQEEETKEDALDSNISQFIRSKASAKAIASNLVVKTSCIEVDGSGTAIITEQCIINDTLNPYWEKDDIAAELKILLGLHKIIWLKGLEETESSTSNVTMPARFVREGVVLVHRNNNQSSPAYELTRENIHILQTEKDAQGHTLKVSLLDGPKNLDKSYLGYYLCNHALMMQNFGDDEADYKAEKIFQVYFPDRNIDSLDVEAIDAKGKDIRAVTLQEPIVSIN